MHFHETNVIKICFEFTVGLQILKKVIVNPASEKVRHP